MPTIISEWIYCPVCGNKTRTMIREDTELKNFPLYCPKCKQETIINVQDCLLYTSGRPSKTAGSWGWQRGSR